MRKSLNSADIISDSEYLYSCIQIVANRLGARTAFYAGSWRYVIVLQILKKSPNESIDKSSRLSQKTVSEEDTLSHLAGFELLSVAPPRTLEGLRSSRAPTRSLRTFQAPDVVRRTHRPVALPQVAIRDVPAGMELEHCSVRAQRKVVAPSLPWI